MPRLRTGTGNRLMIGRVGGRYTPPPAGASGPAFRSASSVNSTSGSLTVTVPTGTTSGDVLLLVVGGGYDGKNGSVSLATPPTGWTLVRSSAGDSGLYCGLWVFSKIAGSSETSVTISGSNWYRIYGSMVALSGSTAVDVSAAVSIANGLSMYPIVTSVSPTGTKDVLLYIAAGASGATTPTAPSGMTAQVASLADSTNSLIIATQTLAASGATGTRQAGGTALLSKGTLVAIK